MMIWEYSGLVEHGPFHVDAAGVKLNGVTAETMPVGHFLRAAADSASHPGIEGALHTNDAILQRW
jgi:hypothetical protein